MKERVNNYINLLEVMSFYRKADKPISRKELVNFMRIEDRTIREIIAKARKRGIPILSDSSNYGYYLSYKEEDISRFLNQEILSKIQDLNETFQALVVHIKPIDYARVIAKRGD